VLGFTLVEMLVVIVIIGILAGLLTGAVIMARSSARVGICRAEIAQLEMALEMYKNKFGEYPPDFAFTASSVPDALRIPARQRVLNHIRKRWPRYVLPPGDVDTQWNTLWQNLSTLYGNLDISENTFTPASALVFWLGGLPEDGTSDRWVPQGFHSDPTNPFKPGTPREKPLFEFDRERIISSPLSYRPNVGNIPTGPIVYFRSYRMPSTGRYEYGYLTGNEIEVVRFPHDGPHPEFGQAVPYLEPWTNMPDPSQASDDDFDDANLRRSWRNPESFQIISPGLDGTFGIGLNVPQGPGNPSLFRVTKIGARFSPEDYDNIANFCQRTLEDEIQ
jgi:prepilin-type N-terminal cleavage/methylation domain-containing protein